MASSSTLASPYLLQGGSQYDFWTYYCLLSPNSQRELDELFGASLKHEYPSILLYNFNNDPHIFFRACFILIKESFVALQAWVHLFRTGFRSSLREVARDIVDVTVFQFRPDYCIRMEVRLRDQVRIFSPPSWLSSVPLPVSPPQEYDSSYFADLSAQDSLAAFLNTIPDVSTSALGNSSSMLPYTCAPLETYDSTDAVSRYALAQGHCNLDQATTSATGRAFSLGPISPTTPNFPIPLTQSTRTLVEPTAHKSPSFTAQSDTKRENGVALSPNGAPNFLNDNAVSPIVQQMVPQHRKNGNRNTPPARPDNLSNSTRSSSSTPSRSHSHVSTVPHYSEQSPRNLSTASQNANGLQRTDTMETEFAADGHAQEDVEDTRTDDGVDSGYNSLHSTTVNPFSRSEIEFLRDLVSSKRSSEDSTTTREMEVDASLRDN